MGKRVPTVCPDCGANLRLRAQPTWRYGRLAKLLFGVAGFCAFLSFFYIQELARYPDIPTHTLVEGAAALLGMLLGFVAWRLPLLRELHCHRCGWRVVVRGRPDGHGERDAG